MKLEETGLTFEDIKEKVNKYMIETYERMDFLAESAKDQYIYNEKGEKYLDFYAGIAVNSAGSCNEKVVKAVVDQAQTLMHTFNYPYTIPQALLAEKVCTTIGMDKIFFQNSGTEANEAMIKMARKYGIEKYGPNRYHIVTAKMGFHGRTFGAMSATGQPGNGCQVGFGPMTYGFSYAPYNDLQAFKDACTENTIAIMIEPVQGEGGVHPATMEFMKGLREFCDENDMLLLIDEVQTGWCRTGNVMSYMHYGIKPDIVSMAKALEEVCRSVRSVLQRKWQKLSHLVLTEQPSADIRFPVLQHWPRLVNFLTEIWLAMRQKWAPILWKSLQRSLM